MERRRRDNINEQIQELSTLVSELGSSHLVRPDAGSVTGAIGNSKPNKGSVLRKSVEYIRMLKLMVDEKSEREKLLGTCTAA